MGHAAGSRRDCVSRGRWWRAILATVHVAELSAPEQRVLGCLIEKRWTTPDQYPLSLNALRLACNQSTNRDPVVDYDEHTVSDAAQRLSRYGLTRLASYHGSRAVKYRHLADEVLGLDRPQLAVLAVLLLRGAQTPGELKGRTERMHPFGSLEEIDAVLDQLIERDYVRRIDRRPGQKEDRFLELLGGEDEAVSPVPPAAAAPAPAAPGPAAPAPASPAPASPAPAAPPAETAPSSAERELPPQPDVRGLAARVTSLEDEVALLRAELGALHDRLP
jgi:uncharacterized protein YceH (UPF0502 family)